MTKKLESANLIIERLALANLTVKIHMRVIGMTKTTLKIDGMMCGMCESHINDAVRNAFHIKKVTSSHTKNQTVIISENEIDEGRLREAIEKTGYKVMSVQAEPYEKKGLFSFGK